MSTAHANRHLWFGLSTAIIAGLSVLFMQQAGLLPTLIVSGSMVGGLICWRLTTYHAPADPRRVVPIYSLTMGLLMAHILEEYLTGFGPRIGEMTGEPFSTEAFARNFVFIMPTLWILGGLGLYLRHPIGNFIVWFIFFGMVIGEPAHVIVFPLREGGRYHYFPGMWSALFPLVTGIWGMRVMVTDHRAWRRAQAGAT